MNPIGEIVVEVAGGLGGAAAATAPERLTVGLPVERSAPGAFAGELQRAEGAGRDRARGRRTDEDAAALLAGSTAAAPVAPVAPAANPGRPGVGEAGPRAESDLRSRGARPSHEPASREGISAAHGEREAHRGHREAEEAPRGQAESPSSGAHHGHAHEAPAEPAAPPVTADVPAAADGAIPPGADLPVSGVRGDGKALADRGGPATLGIGASALEGGPDGAEEAAVTFEGTDAVLAEAAPAGVAATSGSSGSGLDSDDESADSGGSEVHAHWTSAVAHAAGELSRGEAKPESAPSLHSSEVAPPTDGAQIHHAHLGHAQAEIVIGDGADRLQLLVQVDHSGVSVHAHVAGGEAASALLAGSDELRLALERHGLHLAGLSAGTAGAGGGGGGSAKNDASGGRPRREREADVHGGVAAGPAGPAPRGRGVRAIV